MTIKEIIEHINFGQDALILLFVIGSAYMQMKRVENYQHALEQDFARYIDNTKQIQSIANQILILQEEAKDQAFLTNLKEFRSGLE